MRTSTRLATFTAHVMGISDKFQAVYRQDDGTESVETVLVVTTASEKGAVAAVAFVWDDETSRWKKATEYSNFVRLQ